MLYPLGLFQLLRQLLQCSTVPLSHLLDLSLVVFSFLLDGFLQLRNLLFTFGPTPNRDRVFKTAHRLLEECVIVQILPELLLSRSCIQGVFQFSLEGFKLLAQIPLEFLSLVPGLLF